MPPDDRIASAHAAAGTVVQQLSTRAPDPLREQIRVAMAWNGGVSLAVWMGGVAVEIDRARRARSDSVPPTGRQPDVEPESTRATYAAICEAFDREFVVDILCGASAGGINGALLGAVFRHGRRLSARLMRETWVDIGDFQSLLQPIESESPPALMQGGNSPQHPGKFYKALRDVFTTVIGDVNTPEDVPRVDVVLDVMMTDVSGEPRRFRDAWGFALAAREYRTPLRFREQGDFDVAALATAARASASFPIAFEPFRVAGTAAERAGFSGARYAVDGGLLENAPIKYAIELIPEQPSEAQVKRFLCYVNAAPPSVKDPEGDADEPTPMDVLGYIVNIPRDGRFVDQLYAIDDATKHSELARTAQPDLLRVDLKTLQTTAKALLRTYRRQRLLHDVDEIFDNSAVARRALDAGDSRPKGAEWLPSSIYPPAAAADWAWGIATAQRILRLQLDILRGPLDRTTEPEARRLILEARVPIQAQLAGLATRRRGFLAAARQAPIDDADRLLDELAAVDDGFRRPVFDALAAAWEPFAAALKSSAFAAEEDAQFVARLLADDGDGEVQLDERSRFWQRALAIEVIRRAFAPDDAFGTAQPLLFAQLTPLVETQLFRDPKSGKLPDSGEDKLTGIRLGHFAGFYRRSWRANDFMWGRLDGAARIVDMLVDPKRAQKLAQLEPGRAPWRTLAESLLAIETPHAEVRDWLVREALESAHAAVDGSLVDALATAFESDLRSGDGSLTRIVCARIVQLEIFAEELPSILLQSAKDAELGCYTRPLDVDANDLKGTIEWLRASFASGDTGRLPCLLGRDSRDEAVSNLALQTTSHAMIAGLATMRSVNVALGKLVAVVRVPLLPVTGATSREWVDRLGVVAAFAGAATYVAAAYATGKSDHRALVSAPVLLTWVSALGIFGAVAVPAIRALRKPWPRLLPHGLVAAALLAGTLVLPIFVAFLARNFGVQEVLTTGVANLPGWLTWSAIGVAIGGVPALRLNPLPGAKLVVQGLKRLPLTVLVGIVGGALAGYTVHDLVWKLHVLDVLWSWRFVVVAAAWATVPLLLLYLWFGGRPRLRFSRTRRRADH